MKRYTFEWGEDRNRRNQREYGVSFEEAQYAFFDDDRIIIHDELHSELEERWFCIGKVNDKVLTVRFTYREGKVRIFGAGNWRKWRKYYEQEKNKQR